MGIHPYGLFGTNESNNPFGPDYELKRQLAARQAQLSELSRKDSLSSDDEKRRSQLNNAVNQLQNRINKAAGNNPTANSRLSESKSPDFKSSIDTAEGKVIVKSPATTSRASAIYPKPIANTTPVQKNIPNDHLKGFFLDLKI